MDPHTLFATDFSAPERPDARYLLSYAVKHTKRELANFSSVLLFILVLIQVPIIRVHLKLAIRLKNYSA